MERYYAWGDASVRFGDLCLTQIDGCISKLSFMHLGKNSGKSLTEVEKFMSKQIKETLLLPKRPC
jgi:hypothetical protein